MNKLLSILIELLKTKAAYTWLAVRFKQINRVYLFWKSYLPEWELFSETVSDILFKRDLKLLLSNLFINLILSHIIEFERIKQIFYLPSIERKSK